jgi:hypothetical protein
MTDHDILAAATVLAPLIAKATVTSGMGGGIPTGLFPDYAVKVVDLAMEISKVKHAKTTKAS